MTIVCGIDLSENSTLAANAAAAIARRLQEPLLLVHAVPSVPILAAPPAAPSAHLDAVRAEAGKLHERFGVAVECSAVVGTPEEVLMDAARSARARLMVVSALGAERHRRWLVGSVAERLTQCSTIPVLVVRDSSKIVEWTHERRTLSVVVGVTLDSTSRQALAWAREFCRIGPCELTVAQVVSPWTEQARLGGPAMETMVKLRSEVQEVLLRDLRAWAGAGAGEGGERFVVLPGWGREDTHLTLFAAEVGADLVVVGTNQKGSTARLWQGSTSRGVVHHAHSNVVCVPQGDAGEESVPLAKFSTVLVPTDFSPLSNRSLRVAYGVVAEGGTVHLLNVTSDGGPAGESERRARLLALVPASATARGIRTETHVASGDEPFLVIWHLAGRLGVDAICMATHGRSGASSVVLGSQALEVVRRARQPVILVPPECPA